MAPQGENQSSGSKNGFLETIGNPKSCHEKKSGFTKFCYRLYKSKNLRQQTAQISVRVDATRKGETGKPRTGWINEGNRGKSGRGKSGRTLEGERRMAIGNQMTSVALRIPHINTCLRTYISTTSQMQDKDTTYCNGCTKLGRLKEYGTNNGCQIIR